MTSKNLIVKNKAAPAPGPVDENAELEKWIGQRVGSALQRAYPRLKWAIMVDIPNQMVVIICPFISTTKGYHLHLHRYTIADLQKKAIAVAGEVLERHGIARKQTVNLAVHENARRDLRNSMVTADSAPERINKCL